MKKILYSILFILVLTFDLVYLKAECSDVYNEVNGINYIVLNLNDEENFTVRTEFEGLTNNLYVVVSNDFNDNVRTFHYSDTTEGKFYFDTDDISKNITYTIRIYSEDKSCSTDPLKTITFVTDKYNPYSISDLCRTEYEIEMCSPFYDVKDLTLEEYEKKVQEAIDEASGDSFSFSSFLKKYYLFILIPLLIVIIIFIVKIILLKRGSKNE